MARHLMLITAAILMALQAVSAQEAAAPQTAKKPVLSFYPSPSIEVRGLLGEGESLTGYLLVGSDSKVQLTARLKPLKDTARSAFLHSDYFTFSPNPLSIEAGRNAELSFTVEGGAEPGTYSGELELVDEKSGETWAIPAVARLRQPTNAQIYPEDESPQVNTADWSVFNFLLPRSIRQEGINIRVDNQGSEELLVSAISLALKGQKANAAITERFLKPDSSLLQTEVPAKGLETLSLRFDKKALGGLPTDTYKGELRVYFKDADEPLSTGVTVNKRMGAFGAVLLLILGILVGRWVKGLDKAQNQMELMERFVPLRVKVNQLTDKIAQKHLWDELSQLEKKIDKVKSDESKAEVEELFPPLEKKIDQSRELEALHERLAEQFKEEGADAEMKSQASRQLRAARDAILDGKEEEAREALQKLGELINKLSEERSRGILDEVVIPAALAVKRQMDKMFRSVEGEEGGKTADGGPGWWENFFFRAMQWLSGVKMSARFRYGLIRPLVTLATFTVLLLLGFNEIYINGGETFGAEGIMDYLKLFLWGVVSDVFSRSLTSDELVGRFIG